MNFFELIDQNFLFKGLFFLLFFALIYLVLMRWTKDQGTSGVIAISGSLIIVLLFFERINGDFRNISSNSALNEQILYYFIPIVLVLTIVFLFRKINFRKTLLILGIALVIMSLTPIIYETLIVFSIGVCLIIISILKPILNRQE